MTFDRPVEYYDDPANAVGSVLLELARRISGRRLTPLKVAVTNESYCGYATYSSGYGCFFRNRAEIKSWIYGVLKHSKAANRLMPNGLGGGVLKRSKGRYEEATDTWYEAVNDSKADLCASVFKTYLGKGPGAGKVCRELSGFGYCPLTAQLIVRHTLRNAMLRHCYLGEDEGVSMYWILADKIIAARGPKFWPIRSRACKVLAEQTKKILIGGKRVA
jgi:hypothetical protein